MTKNPLINALAASLYIGMITLFFQITPLFQNRIDEAFAPLIMLSLLVLSVLFMSYAFFFKPIQLYLDGEKKVAASLFGRSVLSFAVVTFALFALIAGLSLL